MLRRADIQVGAVANLDGDQLMSDSQVSGHTWSIVGEVGVRPFLCVAVKTNHSEWLEITRQWSKFRLCLDPWKQPGSSKWMNTKQYIMDARQVLSGPFQSFINASSTELAYHPPGRPKIDLVGVSKVQQEIVKYDPNWVP